MISRRLFSKSIAAAPFIARAQQVPGRARIKVDTERVVSDIDPMIYGNFIEHLGRCIDGGVFQEGSRLSDSNGFRKDVLEATRGLNVGILRWPGGNFSSNYNWMDGIGARDKRAPRLEMAWGTVEAFPSGEHVAKQRGARRRNDRARILPAGHVAVIKPPPSHVKSFSHRESLALHRRSRA